MKGLAVLVWLLAGFAVAQETRSYYWVNPWTIDGPGDERWTRGRDGSWDGPMGGSIEFHGREMRVTPRGRDLDFGATVRPYVPPRPQPIPRPLYWQYYGSYGFPLGAPVPYSPNVRPPNERWRLIWGY